MRGDGDLCEDTVHVDATMGRRVWPEPARGLLELTLTAGAVAPSGVEPRDGHVNEALQEVALGRRCDSPLVLELLVRLEVRAGADQLEAALEAHRGIIGVRGEC